MKEGPLRHSECNASTSVSGIQTGLGGRDVGEHGIVVPEYDVLQHPDKHGSGPRQQSAVSMPQWQLARQLRRQPID